MIFRGLLGICLLATIVATDDDSRPLSTYEVVYEWQQVNFKFESEDVRQDKIRHNEFIPANNIITGIKLSGNRMFLTVPRWRQGVPATLVYVDYFPNATAPKTEQVLTDNKVESPVLIPYPNWAMQQIGNCNSFQYVQSMEIDQFNRMWIIDVGRVNIFTEAVNKCPPKLVIMDLDTDRIINSYEFPSEVVSRENNFLNDVVVECRTDKDDCWAYITDARDAKIVVYDFKDNKSWSVRHLSMEARETAKNFTILDHVYVFNTQVDGIALAPFDKNFDTVYYCPLTSFDVFSVPTKLLKAEHNVNNGQIQLANSDVTLVGTKSSQSDGLAMDSKGFLFFGLLEKNSVNYWNTSLGKLGNSDGELIVQNNIDLQWPDTFAFGQDGYLYATTNRLQRYSTNTLDPKENNIRVVRMFIGTKSYMHSENEPVMTLTTPVDQPPVASSSPLPVVPGDSNYHPGGQYEHVTNNNNNPNADFTTTAGGGSPSGQYSTTTFRPRTTRPPTAQSQDNNGSNNLITSFGTLALLLATSILIF